MMTGGRSSVECGRIVRRRMLLWPEFTLQSLTTASGLLKADWARNSTLRASSGVSVWIGGPPWAASSSSRAWLTRSKMGFSALAGSLSLIIEVSARLLYWYDHELPAAK